MTVQTFFWESILICHDLFTGPGQPVMDLESYMGSLEKKQQSMQKMMGVLQSSSDGMATKFFDQIVISYHIKNNCQLPLSGIYDGNPFISFTLRLSSALESLADRMEKSYGVFATHLTELKMDHNNGEKKSERLDLLLAFLSCVA